MDTRAIPISLSPENPVGQHRSGFRPPQGPLRGRAAAGLDGPSLGRKPELEGLQGFQGGAAPWEAQGLFSDPFPLDGVLALVYERVGRQGWG